jgi:hypothetical protein
MIACLELIVNLIKMYVIALFIWNFIEIAYQNYVGWLAAGHYWSNVYCHDSLFG